MVKLGLRRVVPLVAAMALFAGCGSDDNGGEGAGGSSGGGEPLTIALVDGFSGASGQTAEIGKHVLDMAVQEINADGGVNGRDLVLKDYDSQSKPDVAVKQTQRAITQDKAVAIIGPRLSTESLGVGQLAEQSKVVQMNHSAATPALTEGKKFIFRTSPLAPDLATGLAQTAKSLDAKKVAVLYDSGAFGQASKPAVEGAVKGAGLDLVASVELDVAATSASNEVARAARGKPDAVLVAIAPAAQNGLVAKAMDQAGLKVPLIGYSPIGERDAIDVAAGAYDSLPGVYTLSSADKTKPGYEELLTKYEQKHGEVGFLTEHQLGAWDAIHWLAEALKKSNGEGGEALATALEELPARDALNGAVGTEQDFSTETHDAMSGNYLVAYKVTKDGVDQSDLKLEIAGS